MNFARVLYIILLFYTINDAKCLQVRRSTLKTLETLLNAAHTTEWIDSLASDLLRHVFQRALLEYHDELIAQIEQLWTILVRRLPLAILLPAVCPCVATWICLVMQPSRVPFDPCVLIFPPAPKDLSRRCTGPLHTTAVDDVSVNSGNSNPSDPDPQNSIKIK